MWPGRWKRGVLSFKGVKEMRSEEWFYQIPFFALVSICSGALGALFNALHKLLRRVRAGPPGAPVPCPPHGQGHP